MSAPRRTCPSWLPLLGQAEWRRVAALADPQADPVLLERHASAYATWREAEAELMATGRVVTIRGGPAPSPWVAISDRARAELTLTSARLGL